MGTVKTSARRFPTLELFISAAFALTIHGLAAFNLATLPDLRSLLYAPALKSCDECAISIDLPPPPETLPASLNLPLICTCKLSDPPAQKPAAFIDIDYLHFPTRKEAGEALDGETIPAQNLTRLTCIADKAGRLSDCRADAHTPLAAATVRLFETTARVKPLGGKSVSAPYPVRLSYIWTVTP